jgi:hypothetical protein
MSALFVPLTRILVGLIITIATSIPLRAQDDAASRREAIEMMYPVMIHALETKNFGRARNICDQAIIWEPQNPVHHYNLACIEAQAGGARLPYALGALELAIALGFNEVDHLKTDPDLQPLHGDPKFIELVRKATYNATVDAATSAITFPAAPSKKADAPTTAAASETPAPAAFQEGVPVGLYFMTRYQVAPRTRENAVWYFAPDRRVYRNLEFGCSSEDLAAHQGLRGTASADGNRLVVTWSDGTKTAADLERDGTGFLWDMGIFRAVNAFRDPGEAAGVYEAAQLSGLGSGGVGDQRLELRADGTFSWSGVAFTDTASGRVALLVGSDRMSKGHWKLGNHSLILTDEKGTIWRGIAFPDDDAKTVIKPDRLFFGGKVYKRQL